jgi:hypothetical protein
MTTTTPANAPAPDPLSDPRLIKANLALYNEQPAEALRWLTEYSAEQPEVAAQQPLVLWIDAQAQPRREERLNRLRTLAQIAPQSAYGQMAQHILADEQTYREFQTPRARRTPWLIAAVVGVLLIGVIGGGWLLQSRTPPPVANTATPQPTATIMLVNKATPLPPDFYTARYVGGVLRVTAVEDRSERVVSLADSRLTSPVAGGRFYALQVLFECGVGICDDPPQAALAVRLSDGQTIGVRRDLAVAGEALLQQIAQERSTSGWLVFEIPTTSIVTDLEITPQLRGVVGTPPAPLYLSLEGS